MGVVGVVLAAGFSRRMGRLKALLPFGAHTVIEQVLQPLLQAGLDEVAVVVGHCADAIAVVLAPLPVRVLFNPDYPHGMTTSVQVALRILQPIPDAYLLALVDQPLVGPESIRTLLDAFTHTHKGLIIPTYQKKRGHPIILSAKYRNEVLALGFDQGLNTVTRNHSEDTLEVPMASDTILCDMDYPEEYEAALRRWTQHTAQA